MGELLLFPLLFSFLFVTEPFVSSYDGPLYDSSAYTECKLQPEMPLYNGGMLKNQEPNIEQVILDNGDGLPSLSSDKGQPRHGRNNNKMHRDCDCKAGLLSLDSRDINIAIASASLQPFTEEQWRLNQEAKINEARKRAVTIHVSDRQGLELHGAAVRVEQVSKDFPFGSAIAKTIIGNEEYQKWFVERFNAAVFENELKWDATEHIQGQVNYTIPDQMLEFVRANQIIARGHNIFWENPKYTPKWVLNLTRSDLELAVSSRIQSLMNKYKREFVHWDVSNEMLHFDFYEERLGPDATLKFFKTAHEADPLATLFMNEFNVVETCEDVDSTVDAYGHFDAPNSPLMRGILDKLATLGLPIWLTEVDISNKFSKETQAIYLEQVLREGFSHPAVNGIILWTALRQGGCYQMCLTDGDFNNLPAGDTVDKLLKEWQTGTLEGRTDEHGSYSFFGFLGEYVVTARYGNKTVYSTFSLSRGKETRHLNVQL
ncbi:UNVERIFIED_CONTAM: Endo-1,4-beta-xylanase 1 [Sesamum calycinum]|uniref:Endo-1,4-beta-xylanase 1 n=1 Tax=Sesamum calycinum TaxID=2727403 RepID=A0AAW2R859_9LAMI